MPHRHWPLLRHIPPARLGGFARTSDGGTAWLDLYVWDRDVSAAFFADIAILEVALRSAMSRALALGYGPDWPTAPLRWDVRTRRFVEQVRARLGSQCSVDAFISEVTFGFWVGLLGSGGTTHGRGMSHSLHENLWRSTLHRAFPGANALARAIGDRASRAWVHAHVELVGALRNRVAHHQPIFDGMPRPGAGHVEGARPRIGLLEVHSNNLRVAAMIDRDLGAWMADNSRVPMLLEQRP